MSAMHRRPPAGLLPAVTLAAWLSSAPLAAQDAAAPPLELRDALVLAAPATGPRRTPTPVDPVVAALVRGTLRTPVAGASLDATDDGGAGGRDGPVWRAVRSGDDGAFDAAALRGGWCFLTVDAEAPGVRLLDARGHRAAIWNGRPLAGDPYDTGAVRIPVALRAGRNELWLQAGSRALRARLLAPRAQCTIEDFDRTLPDALRGDPGELRAALLVTNASEQWRTGLRFVAATAGGASRATPLPPLAPLGARKVALELEPPAAGAGATVPFAVALVDADGRELDRTTIEIALRDPGEGLRRTFVSAIDGSVQYYAMQPARPGTFGPDAPPGVLLTLHGAGVEATNQAFAYSPKSGVHVVAPTNRRPFGFDWEDWGRLDALEVLDDVTARERIDASRVYLTGHSMGGHGTWQLGVHATDRFAAIAPSAGWRDFWAYGGAAEWDAGDLLATDVFERAVGPSRTLSFERNLERRGVYVLHGDQDSSVPVDQARVMRARLGAFHPDFAYHEQPGAGHWWGNACMDWPPLIEFLLARRRPDDIALPSLSFATAAPAIASRYQWVEVLGQLRSLAPSSVDARVDAGERRIELRTINVAALTIDLARWSLPRDDGAAAALPAGAPLTVVVDQQDLGLVAWPATAARLVLIRAGGTWTVADRAPPPSRKGPHRDGPFRNAFRNRMLLVYGTRGTDVENAWALDRARLDAEVFRYRGNGSVDVLADAVFRAVDHPDRNVILYGNADTNAAFAAVLDANPVEVERGRVRVGDRTLEGEDLYVLAIRPRAGSAVAAVGIVGGTGIVGMRATDLLPLFVSGVAWPDWTVARASTWVDGIAGVAAAGFFAADWSLGDDRVFR
ncbi:MAG: alpha/beta fold hydrolase [Planctomycetes bacterium]|nr:alpha/beta fold hydrolase [Planctomycetota bacterium]